MGVKGGAIAQWGTVLDSISTISWAIQLKGSWVVVEREFSLRSARATAYQSRWAGWANDVPEQIRASSFSFPS